MVDRPDRTCDLCGQVFNFPANLRAHKLRKRPCHLVVPAAAAEHTCEHCGRGFTKRSGLLRHIRESCKMVKPDEKTEQRIDRISQKQLLAQVVNLTARVEQLTAACAVTPPSIVNNIQNTQTIAPTITNNITIQNTVTITPWDAPGGCITFGAADLLAVIEESDKFDEYIRMYDHERTDPERAPAYIADLFVDLTRRVHANPQAQNIYLSPNRADQVFVRAMSGQWDVAPLTEAIKLLLDGVSSKIHVIILSQTECGKLPIDVQNAVSLAQMVYVNESDECAKLAKEALVAHLINCRTKLGVITRRPV